MWQIKNNFLSKISSVTQVGTTVFRTRQFIDKAHKVLEFYNYEIKTKVVG